MECNRAEGGEGQAGMFPDAARKRPSSLYTSAMLATAKLVTQFVKSGKADWKQAADSRAVRKVRCHVRRNLSAQVLTDLLTALLPSMQDRWQFPCQATVERLRCRHHSKCELVHSHLPDIITVLFSEDIHRLRVNLKLLQLELYRPLLSSLAHILTKLPARLFPLLNSLVICGGSVHSDDLSGRVDELCALLVGRTTRLRELHLPVVSNTALVSVAQLGGLQQLRADRTKQFNRRGLQLLANIESPARVSLQVVHLGVFRHALFEKSDVSAFLASMPALRHFSLLDSDRALVRLDGSRSPGDKVLTYSAFKLAKLECEGEGRAAAPRLTTFLTELAVVDRSLKPLYLLESTPELRRLSIDWQQELCHAPFHRFKPDWFTEMIRGASWASLARQLDRLDLTCPAAHSINSYSLPLEDYTRLFQHLGNLTELRLCGAGQGSPVPLIPILHYCPNLARLDLERSPVHVPDNYEVIVQSCVARSLRKFSYLGEMSSLLVHDFMMRGIAHYMPGLIELEVQPSTVLGYCGLRPDQLLELARLPNLSRLSVPLSIREFEMNLPQAIFVLREFPSLRHLTLSWGLLCDSYDVSKSKIFTMMNWLRNALGAENANINLQLAYRQHPQEYTR